MRFHGADLIISFRNHFTCSWRSDGFTRRATTIVSIFLFSSMAHAALDLSVSGSARSYPLSAVMEAESGYGILLYGSNTAAPWYGYVRPRVIADSAVSYNSIDGALEVFPVSFLGLRAGGESIQNDSEYSSYDCALYTCEGRFYRTYAEAELTLGAGAFFVQAAWRRERWTSNPSGAMNFIDPTSGVALSAHGDSETVWRGVAGYKVSQAWTALAILRYAQTDQSEMLSRFPYMVLRYKNGAFSAAVGGGVFESSLKKQEGSAVALLKWEVLPGIGLR